MARLLIDDAPPFDRSANSIEREPQIIDTFKHVHEAIAIIPRTREAVSISWERLLLKFRGLL